MLAFFRSLLREILPQQPRTFRRRSILDRRKVTARKQEPAAFGRRGTAASKKAKRAKG